MLLTAASTLTKAQRFNIGNYNLRYSNKSDCTAGDKRIDHIFVNKQFKVKRYAILTKTNHGRTPSDHYSVVAVMEYSN
ncbi:hypothetical protein NAF17_01640 [Mucilaginibacter sp. RB4R14]|uniref:hypothetical protein n=1 Tax=Mucilaginibacter aurantiaciroseus TaxID=2949308 RepID=UPI0020909A2E|nr:hypothetical protein [Mucilaginibacter aurantiaciroseus]MCO5934227.1 hypothetical protein [Mucilaginibacter aurantiaciroseus]